MKTHELIILVLLYLCCLYLWTLPIQKNPMPFGEPDGASFFGIGDWMAQYDKPMWILPHPYMWRYGDEGISPAWPGTLWYPPPYHTNLALIQIIGGERVIPIFLFLAITDSLTVITLFFLLRKLFDFWTAILASFLLIFSMRDIISHIWGQWPTLLSFSFIPLILYMYYKYTQGYLQGNTKKSYTYIMPFILASQYLLHPVGLFNVIVFAFIYTVLLIIRYKKLPFAIKNFCWMGFIFLVLIIVMSPVSFLNVFKRGVTPQVGELNIKNFFHFSTSVENSGYPPFWFDFAQTIGPWWLVFFILVGIVFLLLRHKDEDLLLLSWLVGLYLFLQFLIAYNNGRYVRNIIETAHIFYPLMALGVVYLFSFFKIFSGIKKYLRFACIIIFVIVIINSTAKAGYNTLSTAYSNPLQRINVYQYTAGEWMKNNLKPDDDVYDAFSSLIFRDINNVMWLQSIAQRQIRGVKLPWQNNTSPGLETLINHDATYVLVDYSRLVIANAGAEATTMQNWEKEFMQNETLVYNKDNIRIYKLRDSWYANRARDKTSNYMGNDTTKLGPRFF